MWLAISCTEHNPAQDSHERDVTVWSPEVEVLEVGTLAQPFAAGLVTRKR